MQWKSRVETGGNPKVGAEGGVMEEECGGRGEGWGKEKSEWESRQR